MTIDRSGIAETVESLAARFEGLGGHLTGREVRFLAAAAAAVPPELGDILEIGSFKGKSTTIIATAAREAGGGGVVACDPLTLPAESDRYQESPAEVEAAFHATLQEHGVRDLVTFHQMLSGDLAGTWDRPLRMLWIDGDHGHPGAQQDVVDFADHLAVGGIIAMHDVLNGFEGPIRAFRTHVLQDDRFGPCGVCGSIGWAQRVDAETAQAWAGRRRTLARRLAPMAPLVAGGRSPKGFDRLRWKVLRSRVPHAAIVPAAWFDTVSPGWSVAASA